MFSFIDLFSGVGGFRIPLESLGGKCVGFSEIDKAAIEVYKNNFNTDDEKDFGDITKITNLPIVAIGGIKLSNYKKLLLNKANFLAISGYIWENKKYKPLEALKKLK